MSTLLEQASLVLIPSGYAEDKVYSVIPSNGSGDMSFTRASNGTRINSDGLVEVCPWNILQYSEDFTNVWWSKIASTISSNATTAPNDTLTADKLIESAANTSHYLARANAEFIAGTTYTLSFYAKASERTWLAIAYNNESNRVAWFNLSTGVVGTVQANISATSIESVGNGWYRCSITSTTASTQPYPSACVANANGVISYSGDGTSGIFIWGAQMVIGSTAKPYFPTTDRLNVPRLTYQNGGGGCPSLLLEPQRTNVATYSEQFDNAAWSKINATVNANILVSPNGTQNADKFVENNGTGTKWIYNVPTVTSGSVYTYSVFAKKGERDFIYINAFSNGNFRAWFNLNTGTIGATDIGASAKIENYGNGWYRCSVTFTAALGTNFYLLGVSNANNVENYTGDGISGIYIWGAQNELGSYATSYIPTVASSATRVADACFKSTSLLANQTIACFFVDVVINQQPDNYAGIMEMRNGTTCDFYMLQYQASNTIEFRARGSNGVENTVAIATALGRKKIAMYRNGDRLAVFINGVKQADQTSATAMSAFANSAQTFYYNFDPAFGTYSNCININESIIFAGNALTDAELISLTTI